MARRNVALVVALALVGAFAAFAGGQGEAAESEKVTIDFMHLFIRGEGNEGFFAALDEFGAENPNIIIREDVVQHDQYHGSKFKTLAAANELPDLFMINSMEIRGTVQQGLLMDWTPVLNTHKDWRDTFVPGIFVEVMVNDKIWAVPRQLIANNAIYYNEKILADAGYSEFPATWSEFMELSADLRDRGIIPVAMGNKAGWVAISNFVEVLAHRTAGEDWFYSIKNNNGAKYTDPEFVLALELFKEFNDAGYFNEDVNAIDGAQANAYYYNGEAAMMVSGSWGVGGIVTEAPEEIRNATRIATMPAVRGGKGEPGVLTGGSGWSFAASSKVEGAKQDAIVDLVQALTSPDTAAITLENNQMPPLRKEIVDFDQSKVSGLQNQMNELMADAPVIATMYAVQVNPAVAEALYRKTQEIMVGTATPKEAAAEVQETYEQSFLSVD